MNETVPLEIFYIYFSPYTAHAIEIAGVIFPTVEHAYQAARYTEQKIISEIKNATSPVKAWEISTKYKHLQIEQFKNQDYKRETMKKMMRLKMMQHEEVRQALINTGEKKIVKHIVTYPPGDGFWDDGSDGTGQNEIGKIWMELRAELKNS